jgi:hypothetical protein
MTAKKRGPRPATKIEALAARARLAIQDSTVFLAEIQRLAQEIDASTGSTDAKRRAKRAAKKAKR